MGTDGGRAIKADYGQLDGTGVREMVEACI